MKKTYLTSALMLAAFSGGLMAQTLVTVNGTKIDSKEIDAQVKLLQSQSNGRLQDSPALRQNLTQRQVTQTLVTQEARRLKLEQSSQYKQALEQARAAAKQDGSDKQPNFKQQWAVYEGDLLAQAYMAYVLGNNPVTDSDVQRAYTDFSNFYKGSQEVQLGEILTRSSTDAQKAEADLKAKKKLSNRGPPIHHRSARQAKRRHRPKLCAPERFGTRRAGGLQRGKRFAQRRLHHPSAKQRRPLCHFLCE